MTNRPSRLNWNMSDRRMVNLKSPGFHRCSEREREKNANLLYFSDSSLMVWHNKNAIQSSFEISTAIAGQGIVFIQRRRIGLPALQWQAEKRFFPRNREREQTSITDLPHPNNPRRQFERLYILFTDILLHLILVSSRSRRPLLAAYIIVAVNNFL